MQPPETAVKQSASAGASPFPSGHARVAHWVTLLLLLAAGTGARLVCLTHKPYWFDETFSVEVARIDWRSFLHLLWWREANMSLYYVLLRTWLHLGQSEFFIRSLSVLFAVATLPAIYWVARLLYNRRVALIATALLAFNSYHVRYSQEARGYTLFLLLATLSCGFLIAFLREPSNRARRGYILASILAVYGHFYALLLLAVHWMAVRWMVSPGAAPDQRNIEISAQLRRSWIRIGLAVLPLLVFVAKTGAGPIRWIQRPGLHDVLAFCENFAGSNRWPLALIYAIACIAAVAPFRRQLRARGQSWEVWRCQFLVLWLLFPVVLTIVASIARPVFLPRYLIFCLPALLILAAAGLARLRQSSLLQSSLLQSGLLQSGLLAVVLTGMLFLSLQGIFFVYDHDLDTSRDAAGAATYFILDHTQPGDAVFFHIPQIRVPYEFYRSVRAGEDSASSSFTGQVGPEILYPHYATGLSYRDFRGKLTEDFVRATAPGHRRVWVVLMYNGPKLPDPTAVLLSRVLPETFPKVQRWQFPQVEIRLYSKE